MKKNNFTSKRFLTSMAVALLLLLSNGLAAQATATMPQNYYVDSALEQQNTLVQSVAYNSDAKTIHIFSHGKPGELLINGKCLNKEEIAAFVKKTFPLGEMSEGQWGLNIYGCEFAKGNKGQQAIAYLEQTLGVQIAASTNLTGADGDWVLETTNFDLNQKSQNILENYQYTLQTTFTRRVGASSDDAEQRVSNGSMQLTSSDLELVRDPDFLGGSGIQLVGIRFTNLAIPVGSVITNAFITFRAVTPDGSNPANNSNMLLAIRAHNVANSGTFTTGTNNISNRTTTSAVRFITTGTGWTTGSNHNVENLQDIINEVIGNAGWASGNSISFIINESSGTGGRSAASWDGSASNAPLLTVTYNACPTSVSNTTSTASINEQTTKNLTASQAGGTYSIISGGGNIVGNTYTAPIVNTNTQVTIRYTLSTQGCPTLTSDVTFTVINSFDECSPSSGLLDTDGDGITDFCDLDDDNDGILDCVEDGLSGSVSDYFNLAGDATEISSNEFRLTPALNNQAGSAMTFGKVDLTKAFSFTMEANFGNRGGSGGDGIAFVFHNDPAGTNAVGSPGAGIGANGLINGLAIEFDTYDNAGDGTPNGTGNDISQDHAAFWDTDAGPFLPSTPTNLKPAVILNGGEIETGLWYPIFISWNPVNQRFTYIFNNNATDFYEVPDVNTLFGSNRVFFGITSSTGLAFNDHRIRITDACSLPFKLDSDNDGIANSLDNDSDNDGVPDSLEANSSLTPAQIDVNGRLTGPVNSAGIKTLAGAGFTPIDTDGDGVPNFRDIDSDNDGIVDIIESQPTVGYKATTGIVNARGIDNAFNTTGNGVLTTTLTNTDGTDVPDMFDADSDNDGKSDMLEAAQGTYAAADTDGDGLANVFDLVVLSASPTTNTTNGGQTPINPFPRTDSPAGQPNWRNKVCTQLPNTSAATSITVTGFSAHTSIQATWPGVIPNGVVALESSRKGFVITRITTAARDAASFVPVEGMLIYNTTVNRFQLRKANIWVNLKRGCIN